MIHFMDIVYIYVTDLINVMEMQLCQIIYCMMPWLPKQKTILKGLFFYLLI